MFISLYNGIPGPDTPIPNTQVIAKKQKKIFNKLQCHDFPGQLLLISNLENLLALALYPPCIIKSDQIHIPKFLHNAKLLQRFLRSGMIVKNRDQKIAIRLDSIAFVVVEFVGLQKLRN